MGIKVSAIFLMMTLVAGFTSFPLSLSNSSTEIVDQPYFLNLINMAFAASDKEEKAADKADKAADKAAYKADKAADKAAYKADKAADKAAYKADKAADKAERKIQKFYSGILVHTSSTTSICHIPPGNYANAHTITIGMPAVRAHLAHGDEPGVCPYNGLGNIMSKKEIYQAQKLTRLAEKQTEKESMALDRANKLIEKLEQRIAQLEQRLQTLLDKVESGEYYGTLTELDTVTQSHSISFDGTATSIYDESVTTGLSGEIFIENLMTGSNTSKFKVTGGAIIVGDNIYDAAFGKVRVSSLGVPDEKDSMVVIIQTFDSEDNDNTIKLTLLFDSAIKADLGTEPISFEIKPNSKISEQWFLSGSGTLSLE